MPIATVVLARRTEEKPMDTKKPINEPIAETELVTEDLIEDVSIDGMCGVY